jgi:hypothetical protein
MPTTYLWQQRLLSLTDKNDDSFTCNYDITFLIEGVRSRISDLRGAVKYVIEQLTSVPVEYRRVILIKCLKLTRNDNLVNHVFETAIGCP